MQLRNALPQDIIDSSDAEHFKSKLSFMHGVGQLLYEVHLLTASGGVAGGTSSVGSIPTTSFNQYYRDTMQYDVHC